MRVFSCRVLFPPMIKSLPPTALSLKTKCSRSGGKRFHCAVAFLLVSLKPLRTDGQLNHLISIAQIYSSLSFPAAACFLPPLLEARKTFANCEKLLPVLNKSGFEMQSSMIDVIIPGHGLRNFMGIYIANQRNTFTAISFQIW